MQGVFAFLDADALRGPRLVEAKLSGVDLDLDLEDYDGDYAGHYISDSMRALHLQPDCVNYEWHIFGGAQLTLLNIGHNEHVCGNIFGLTTLQVKSPVLPSSTACASCHEC